MTLSRPRVRQLTSVEEILLQRAVQKVAKWHQEAAAALVLSVSDMQSEGGPAAPKEAPDPMDIMKERAEHYARVASFLAGKRLGQQEAKQQEARQQEARQ